VSLLALRGITFAHPGGGDVLRGLSLDVEEGSIAAILGPNGSGKTTLLDICLGWRRPARGSVALRGRPLESWSRRERGALMSLVPQRENVRFDFSVREYVLLGRAPHLRPLEAPGRPDEAIVRGALEAAGIARLADRSIATLSGGEYQLMLIARSLAQQPALLLLDEPASQLDPANQLAVIRLLRRLRDRGITVVYTSHNPQAAAIAADVIHMLKAGRFAVSAPPRQALTAENLRRVYGIAFRVSWNGRLPHVRWEAEETPVPPQRRGKAARRLVVPRERQAG
jgi:iron complex transport system ATP-binding protein